MRVSELATRHTPFPPPLWGRAREGGTTNTGVRDLPPSLTLPHITPELKAAMPDLRGRLLANESLAPLTWFRVGGAAQVLFTPADADDLAYFLKRLPAEL